VLLGVSDDATPEKTSLAWQNAALYFLSIGLWGVCDGLASYVGRDLHVFYVAGAGGAGFAAVALVSAALGYGLSSGAAASTVTSAQSGLSQSSALALVALAQCAGVGAWFMSVKLGVLSECSSFLPITSLYTILASGAALLIFNEKPPPLYFFGMPLAAIGILCIAFGAGGGNEGGNGLHKPLEEAGETTRESDDTSRTGNTHASVTMRSSTATARTNDDDW
jgi:uncharacterized membrane protein